MDLTQKFCGNYIPIRDNYIDERLHAHNSCLKWTTTLHPVQGTLLTFPETGAELLYMPHDASHFTLDGPERYNANCYIGFIMK